MRVLGQIGWAALIVIGTLVVFVALGLGASLSVTDAIMATILVDALILVAGLLLRRTRPSWVDYDGGPRPFDARTGFAVAGLFVLVFFTGQAAATAIHDSLGSAGFDAVTANKAQANPLLLVALTLVLAPMAEEMLLRGLAYPLLRRRLGVIISALISAGIFALIHGNLIQAAAVVPMGVVLALIYERTRSIWPGVAAHAVYNMAAVLVPPGLIHALATPLPLISLGFLAGIGFIVVITRMRRSALLAPVLADGQV